MKKSSRRQFTTSTFFVEGQRCKIFFQRLSEFKKGFWAWNVGFAVGKSNRQLNDWYWKRKNKRARSINNKMTGKAGLKTIKKGFEEVLKLRWIVNPGDVIFLDCTSGDPERQFKAWSRWHRYHPEWTIDYEKKIFFFHTFLFICSGIVTMHRPRRHVNFCSSNTPPYAKIKVRRR